MVLDGTGGDDANEDDDHDCGDRERESWWCLQIPIPGGCMERWFTPICVDMLFGIENVDMFIFKSTDRVEDAGGQIPEIEHAKTNYEVRDAFNPDLRQLIMKCTAFESSLVMSHH